MVSIIACFSSNKFLISELLACDLCNMLVYLALNFCFVYLVITIHFGCAANSHRKILPFFYMERFVL